MFIGGHTQLPGKSLAPGLGKRHGDNDQPRAVCLQFKVLERPCIDTPIFLGKVFYGWSLRKPILHQQVSNPNGVVNSRHNDTLLKRLINLINLINLITMFLFNRYGQIRAKGLAHFANHAVLAGNTCSALFNQGKNTHRASIDAIATAITFFLIDMNYSHYQRLLAQIPFYLPGESRSQYRS
jgi:hypothetical protein